MLILTRRLGESIIVGDSVKLCVLNVKGYQVQIGIDAPNDISVHREEIYLRIQREKSLGLEANQGGKRSEEKPLSQGSSTMSSNPKASPQENYYCNNEYPKVEPSVKTEIRVKKKRVYVKPETA